MVKAVIFDMDGILIDSEPFWRKSETEVLKQLNVPITEEICIQKSTGIRIDLAVKRWYEEFSWKNPSINIVVDKITQRTIEYISLHGHAMKGVIPVLDFFKRKSVKKGVASSAPLKVITYTLDKIGIKHYFDIIHSAEFEKRAKPHPDVFLSAADKLQIVPEDCLVFEDSPVGVEAAKKAGMICVAITRNPQNEIYRRADYIFSSLEAFLDFSGKNLIEYSS